MRQEPVPGKARSIQELLLTPDAQLIDILEGCKRNERYYQKILYQQYYQKGMEISLRHIKPIEKAVAIMNQAFLKIFKLIDCFDIKHPFDPWFNMVMEATVIQQSKNDMVLN